MRHMGGSIVKHSLPARYRSPPARVLLLDPPRRKTKISRSLSLARARARSLKILVSP